MLPGPRLACQRCIPGNYALFCVYSYFIYCKYPLYYIPFYEFNTFLLFQPKQEVCEDARGFIHSINIFAGGPQAQQLPMIFALMRQGDDTKAALENLWQLHQRGLPLIDLMGNIARLFGYMSADRHARKRRE